MASPVCSGISDLVLYLLFGALAYLYLCGVLAFSSSRCAFEFRSLDDVLALLVLPLVPCPQRVQLSVVAKTAIHSIQSLGTAGTDANSASPRVSNMNGPHRSTKIEEPCSRLIASAQARYSVSSGRSAAQREASDFVYLPIQVQRAWQVALRRCFAFISEALSVGG